MKILQVGIVQHRCVADRTANIKRSTEGIREAAQKGAQLVVLQELHAERYFCDMQSPDRFNAAESIPGPSTDHFGALAKSLNVVLVLSLFERREKGIYHNAAVVLEGDGSITGRYRKMHIPDDPGYNEKYYFTPGDLGFSPIATSVGTLGVMVCWDQWYPEAARLMALAGADLLIYPTAIGWDSKESDEEHVRQRDAWITIQRSHAIANSLPVISVNRTGWEPPLDGSRPGTHFWGSSFAVGCQGEFLAQAPVDEEAVMVVPVDMTRSEIVRRLWPFFRDRRIDAYQGLLARFGNK